MAIINNSLAYSGESLIYNHEYELLWPVDHRTSAEIYNNGTDPMIIGPGGDTPLYHEINAPITGYDYITTKFKIWCNAPTSESHFIEYGIRANGDDRYLPYWNWHVSNEPWDIDPMTTDGCLCYRFTEYNTPDYQFTATGGRSATFVTESIWYDQYSVLGRSTSANPHYYRLILSPKNSVASAYLDNKYIGSGSLPAGRTALSAYTLTARGNHGYTVGIRSFKVGGFSDYEDALSWE